MNYKMSEQALNFIGETTKELVANGISVHLYQTSLTPQGYSGSFCDKAMEFNSSLGKETEAEAFAIYIHEYNHFRQWIENSKVWTENEDFDTLDAWLEGKIELSPQDSKEQVLKALRVELDCEIRTSAMIKDKGFNIGSEWYVKKANAYLFFYPIMGKYRSWYDVPPYESKEIVDSMPNYYLNTAEDYWDNVPEGFDELIHTYCF
jgi:hypothetical protein